MDDLGEAIRAWRAQAMCSQRQLAAALSISPAFLNDIEHGRRALDTKHFFKMPRDLEISAWECVIAGLLNDLDRASERLEALRHARYELERVATPASVEG